MKFINVLLSIIVSLGLGLLILEGGLRLIGKGPAPASMLEFDSTTGWAKKPGFVQHKRSPAFDITISVNEQGLRDDAMATTAKPDGVYRVVALGDSFVQGFTVDREDLFVDLLEDWWQAEGRSVEIINAGTEAWDTAQQAAWLEANAEAYAPDLVLVFPYENDLYWNSQRQYFSGRGVRWKPRYDADGVREEYVLEEPPAQPWHQSFGVTKWLGKPDRSGAAAHAFTPSGGASAVSKELAPLVSPEPTFGAQIRAHTKGALAAIARTADSVGAAVVIAPIPSAAKYDKGWSDRYEAPTREGGRGLGSVDWNVDRPVDLVLELSGELADSGRVVALDARPALEGSVEPLYYSSDIDWHFNPRGNRVFAEFLHDSLDGAEGLGLPAATATASIGASTPTEGEEGGLPFWVKLYVTLFVVATGGYYLTYTDEAKWQPPLKVGALLGVIFAIFMGVKAGHDALPVEQAVLLRTGFVVLVLGVVLYYLGRKIFTIGELIKSFILRGHWYLMPLLVVLLTVGSLLVVAASNPFVAPFIYTLF